VEADVSLIERVRRGDTADLVARVRDRYATDAEVAVLCDLIEGKVKLDRQRTNKQRGARQAFDIANRLFELKQSGVRDPVKRIIEEGVPDPRDPDKLLVKKGVSRETIKAAKRKYAVERALKNPPSSSRG
jgi:hypothetical protein